MDAYCYQRPGSKTIYASRFLLPSGNAKNVMIYKYLFLLITFAITVHLRQVNAQSNRGQHDIFLKTVFEKAKITGASINEIKDNAIGDSYHHGLLNTNTQKVVTEQSVFEAASLSKPVFCKHCI